MLRNLRTKRFLGTPFRGIRGSAIPSTGANGASVIYNDISLPTEANDEFRFRLTALPASGSFFMYEDGSFKYIPAADGNYAATGVLVKNGADVGPETITLQSGGAATTISTTPGNAAATGAQAAIQQGRTIACNVGTATATGAKATIRNDLTIACKVGVAAATGAPATVINAGSAPGTIPDASTISASRTVNFGGGTNRVDFGGGTNRVDF